MGRKRELIEKIKEGFGSLWNIKWLTSKECYEVTCPYPLITDYYIILHVYRIKKGWRVTDGGYLEKGSYFEGNGFDDNELEELKWDLENKKVKILQEIYNIRYHGGEYCTEYFDIRFITNGMMHMIEFISTAINSIYLDSVVKDEKV